MPDSECGPWIAKEVLFGEPAASAHAQADANKQARNEEAALRRIRVRFAWEAWGDCWVLLNAPLLYPDDDTVQHVRNTRADEVEAMTADFVRKHVAAVGTTEGLYLHILHAHAHEQVRKWGDLRVRQTQGLEHCHKNRKQVGLNGTNRKKGQRIETMLTHKHVLAKIEREHSAGFKSRLTHQKKSKGPPAGTRKDRTGGSHNEGIG